MADPFQATKSRRVCSPARQICLAPPWCGRTIFATASVSARSRANRHSFGRRRTPSRRPGSCRRCSLLGRMSAAGSAPCRRVPLNPAPRLQNKTDQVVLVHRRLAQNLASASRRTGPARPGKARLPGSPCSSKGARAALACKALRQPVRALHRESCAAIRASATNATSARVGRPHQMRPVLRPQRAPRRVHSVMKAEEMCAEPSPGGISAA